MGATLEPVLLRPLGIGEIFDRAVTIYVRNFLLFAMISAFVVVPISIVNYFATDRQSGAYAQILDQIQHPARSTSQVPTLPFSPWFGILIGVSLLLTPFMYVAMAAALGRIYSGAPGDWRSAYRTALRHAGGVIMTTVVQMFILAGAAFVGVFALSLSLVAAFLLIRFAPVLGVIAIILSALLFLAYIVALMLCYLAMALAFDAIGIEEASFGAAISRSFARVFNRVELGKATLVCLAFAAVQIGLLVVSVAGAALIEAVVHQTALQALFSGVVTLISTGFIGVLIAVYYFDVRVRREGLDMQAAIDQLQATS